MFDTIAAYAAMSRQFCVLTEAMQQYIHASNCVQPMSLLVPSRTLHFHVYDVLACQHQRQLNNT